MENLFFEKIAKLAKKKKDRMENKDLNWLKKKKVGKTCYIRHQKNSQNHKHILLNLHVPKLKKIKGNGDISLNIQHTKIKLR